MLNNKRSYEDEWFNGIYQEENRKEIHTWRSRRIKKSTNARKIYHGYYKIYSFDLETLYSFIQNFNMMVILQMLIAGITVHIFKVCDISFDIHVSLIISPIVFPLAFSINSDFQRREKVLDDLAVFKSSGMVWFFCMREWKQDAGLDNTWMSAVHGKLKSLLFHLREYLLTSKINRRTVILRAMYEDFSDINQLIDRVRTSKLPANTAIVSRAVHLLNMMCLSFERLRVVREYRSPRSIRSFNKVLIFLLPILIGPYFVHLGEKSKNTWQPYYISILVTMVFSSLQGVQDTLDNPFSGMTEDDINLDTIDEWTFNSLEATIHRSFNIGRFTVKVEAKDQIPLRLKTLISQEGSYHGENDETDYVPNKNRKSVHKHRTQMSNIEEVGGKVQKWAELLEGKTGDTCITRQSLRNRRNISESSDCPPLIFKRNSLTDLNKGSDQSEKKRKVSFADNDVLLTETGKISRSPLTNETEKNETALPLLSENLSTNPFDELFHKATLNAIPENVQDSHNIESQPLIQDHNSSVYEDSKTSSAALLIKEKHTNDKFHVDTVQDNNNIINCAEYIPDTPIEERYSMTCDVPPPSTETNDNLVPSCLPCGVPDVRYFETSSLGQVDTPLVASENDYFPRSRFNVLSLEKSNPVKESTSQKDELQTSGGIDYSLISVVKSDNVKNKFHVISIEEQT